MAKRSDLAYGVAAGGNQIHGPHRALLGEGMSKRRPKPDRNEDGRARSLKKGRVEVEGEKKRKEAEEKEKGNARSGPSWAGRQRRAQFIFQSALRFNRRKIAQNLNPAYYFNCASK